MKQLTTLLLIALFSTQLSAQKIPRKADRIELQTTYTSVSDAVVGVAKSLMSEGVSVESYDKDMGMIKTGQLRGKGVEAKADLFLHVKDSTVIISVTGKYSFGANVNVLGTSTNAGWSSVSHIGMRGSLAREAWDTFHRIVDLIPHEEDPVYFVPEK